MVKLVRGKVLHQRRTPFVHGLKFTNYLWLVDLNSKQNKLLPKDHFGGEAPTMVDAVKYFAESRGEEVLPTDKVLALASSRTNGYVFNPLSVYWCIDSSGKTRWAILEIHNTYGDRHAHLIKPDAQGNATLKKEFYVSPFFTVDGDYKARAFIDGKHVVVSVNLYQNNALVFSASFTGEQLEASIKNRLAAYIRTPFSTLQATARIRAHGIWLWLRRLPVIPRPNHPKESGML
ncbi:MAG: DUF1365 domain-containing protein [Candidatus Nanopelagicaceae bacterium]|jgi:DUF1365 family protein